MILLKEVLVMFGISPSVFWIIAVIIFAILEAASLGLTAIWFAFGSLAAAIVSCFGAGKIVQLIVFIAVSGICVVYTRPVVQNKLKVKNTPTNLDRVIGQTAVVTEEINNELGVGQIKAGGLVWTARSEDDSVIEKDSKVTVTAIQGVKAIVKK